MMAAGKPKASAIPKNNKISIIYTTAYPQSHKNSNIKVGIVYN